MNLQYILKKETKKKKKNSKWSMRDVGANKERINSYGQSSTQFAIKFQQYLANVVYAQLHHKPTKCLNILLT
jgi:hypothetical protein